MYLIQFTRQKPPGFGGVERIANDISNFALSKAIKVFNIYFSNANRCSQKTKYTNINRTGNVTITDPAIKYCLGVSASPLKYWIALESVNEFGLSKNIKENKNSFQAIINT